MPELPETETIARDLDGALRGAVVRSVEVVRSDVLRGEAPGRSRRSAAALAAEVADALTGAKVHGVSRRAKSVVIAFGTVCAGGQVEGLHRLVVTPRFTGALLIDGTPDDAYTCLRLDLADGRSLRYHDVRRLGTLALLGPSAFEAWEMALGPEPLDPALTPERFSGIIRGSSRAVKSILMDQKRLAGVGNIYANEALWRARIRPTRRGERVTRVQCALLLSELRAVLSESIALRGTTFRDYRDAYGGRGGFAARLQAYGRAGEPCSRCGDALSATHALEGRQTVWCRACQS
ncbi:MAG: bifunctional DNA-formamidopyrimidine glycosylase/DNA-(apurinic or apyrimidinic site) lyase [Gemmatimonadetes bacterium]|nr:bifunctional DNA-formamidopyrimidine glycosylase/DNA-(apurinic or apyrimidinic site) lyase [Gemmatimonadota bacterium]